MSHSNVDGNKHCTRKGVIVYKQEKHHADIRAAGRFILHASNNYDPRTDPDILNNLAPWKYCLDIANMMYKAMVRLSAPPSSDTKNDMASNYEFAMGPGSGDQWFRDLYNICLQIAQGVDKISMWFGEVPYLGAVLITFHELWTFIVSWIDPKPAGQVQGWEPKQYKKKK